MAFLQEKPMEIERRTAGNTAIVLIDYVTGFGGMIGSQTIAQNVAGARALAQTALAFKVPLVVTMGPELDPRGVIYPELAEQLGDHPIVYRAGSFDAFAFDGFEQAIAATGVKHLVIGGLMTDGCVMQTSLSALRRDYDVSLVVDASASQTEIGQQTAIQRLTKYGVNLTTWLSFASELQVSYDNVQTVAAFRKIQANSPAYAMLQSTMAGTMRFAESLRQA
jgi:nicotinamidase-related amidase